MDTPRTPFQPMKAKKTPHAYVYRAIDPEENIDGYLAKVIRRDARLHKIYQIAKYDGDAAKCLRAAINAVREFTRDHPLLTRQQIAELPRKKKDTDLPVGVRRVRNQVKGRFYDFFEAEWSPTPNHQKKKRFSVNYYGEDEAEQLAIDARERGVANMRP